MKKRKIILKKRKILLFLWELLFQIYIITCDNPWLGFIAKVIIFVLKQWFENSKEKEDLEDLEKK